MTTFDASDLLRGYKEGVGFKTNDILTPREGAAPECYGALERKVIVIDGGRLAPHQYLVLGENAHPRTPADRFVRFEINGHDWQKIGEV